MKYLAYTYLIKCPNGKSYYGYRSANKTSPEDDLWKHYYTSSKLIAELREQYSDDEFIATVDKTFETAEEAYDYETKFLKENDCVNSDDWVNQQCFPVFNSNTGREHTEEAKRKMSEAGKRRKHTEETRRKLSEAAKRRKHTEETKRKMSESHKGKKMPERSEEHRRKLSESGKRRKHTEETKRKMSESTRKEWAQRKNKQKD